LQAVINVDRFKISLQPAGTVSSQQMQQNLGIHPATVADDQPANLGIAVEQRRDAIQDGVGH